MKEFRISNNSNGKLFRDCFHEIKPRTGDYKIGEKVQVKYNGTVTGIAEIVAIKDVKFCNISETVSFGSFGKPAYLLAAHLKKESPTRVEANDVFENIVLQWLKIDRCWFEDAAKIWFDAFMEGKCISRNEATNTTVATQTFHIEGAEELSNGEMQEQTETDKEDI